MENEDDILEVGSGLSQSHFPALIESKELEVVSLDKLYKYKTVYVQCHPFIFSGYRIHHTLWESIKSMFKANNETANIWSHLLPCIFFLSLLIYTNYSIFIDFNN